MEAVRHNTRTYTQPGRADLIDQTRLTPKAKRQIKTYAEYALRENRETHFLCPTLFKITR
jgi:hypothetical protein